MQPPQYPHPYAPPPSRPGWPPAAQRAVGCGSCCGVLVLLEVLAMWGVLSIGYALRPPEGLRATVTVPRVVVAGRKFPLTLVVRNEGKEPFTVTTVTVRSTTLKRVALSNPQPAPTRTTQVWGSVAWGYQTTLEPGEKWTARLDATAAQAGEARGAIEVQSGLSGPRRAKFRVAVREPGAGESRD